MDVRLHLLSMYFRTSCHVDNMCQRPNFWLDKFQRFELLQRPNARPPGTIRCTIRASHLDHGGRRVLEFRSISNGDRRELAVPHIIHIHLHTHTLLSRSSRRREITVLVTLPTNSFSHLSCGKRNSRRKKSTELLFSITESPQVP